ncbi:hypothetical protein ATCC90586_003266 [Pythium insidiosum]|nr:hypothetical protein ATCC90586_003266 [Pythium insidiosum]
MTVLYSTNEAYGDEDSVFRGRPPRIAKVRAIEANARLLRPTKASLARTTTKRRAGGDLFSADDKENVPSNIVRRRTRLTIPKSPKFQRRPKKQPRSPQLTRTSRELREIAAIKKKVQETRKRNQRYHEATTRGLSEQSSFTKALQSCGGLGVPAVRRPQLTTPVEFNFEVDKRAMAKKRKLCVTEPLPREPAKRWRA